MNRLGAAIRIAHSPRSCSKFNPIDHRANSAINRRLCPAIRRLLRCMPDRRGRHWRETRPRRRAVAGWSARGSRSGLSGTKTLGSGRSPSFDLIVFEEHATSATSGRKVAIVPGSSMDENRDLLGAVYPGAFRLAFLNQSIGLPVSVLLRWRRRGPAFVRAEASSEGIWAVVRQSV